MDETEQKRQQDFIVEVKSLRKKFEDEHFENASKFLFTLLNNYEVLILFFDSIYLQEDFVKVAGGSFVCIQTTLRKRCISMPGGCC